MNRPIARCLSGSHSILITSLATLQALLERRKLVATALAVTALAGASAAAGKDLTPADKGNGFSVADEAYLRTYEKCWKAFDSQCGRNIVDDQLASGEPPSETQVKRSTATMERWLNPPEPEPTVASSTYSSGVAPSAPVATTVAPASGGCTGMEAESGSAGYDAYNPSSGAAGCYQIIPSTAAAHGCDLSTPGGQDACAASICATEGPGAWSASGVSPC